MALEKLTLDEKVDWIINSMGTMQSKIAGLQSDMDNNYQKLRSEFSNMRAELYKRESEMLQNMMVGSSFGGGPFKMEASPCSTGDSATDPSYDIFTDDDYGL